MSFLLKDQLGRDVKIDNTSPQRIVSLVPSQTELLFDLGLDEEIAGLTKFCIHPANKVQKKTKIGGTKKLEIEKIKSLKPTLIIANKEENEKDQIEELANYFSIWISDVIDLSSALEMVLSVGRITGKEKEAIALNNKISERFTLLSKEIKPGSTAAYFIWKEPLMVAGDKTFINDMLQRCGFQNCFHKLSGHYPEISTEQLQEVNPKFILLSSEPYPFKKKHRDDFKKICPDSEIILVDGEMFSWYGSRLLQAPSYFKKLAEDLRH